ncbi:vacuolar protein sorting 38-like isoform X2 [Curcuma longa]|uniref:vacuolar protein sorting 38-like isoform X2 n=1 Tax=Curcuma longa TaxID=136217 RepID=UPI003D9E72E5
MESDRIRGPDLAPGTELSEWAICDAQEIEGGDDPKIVDWEDLQQELARLWSLSSALKKAKERKESLSERLESFIEVRKGSLRQTNELEEMKEKLEAKRLALEDLSMHIKQASENSQKERDKLWHSTRLLLVAGKRLTVSHQQLQEASKLLSGERGYDNLKNLQKLLRLRQGDMVAQISTLYPTKSASEQPSTEATDPHPLGKSSSLQLTMLPIKTMGYFSDKKEVRMFASALGYVAHAVSLISSYLYVPLRYPLRFKGSRSYIYDHTSIVDNATSDLMGNSASLSTSSKSIDFPLFLDGQDTTRAAYAIFLLNKNLEQLLNYIGAESLGPRHILPNLKELVQIILSKEYP